jgi:hypothetical protein
VEIGLEHDEEVAERVDGVRGLECATSCVFVILLRKLLHDPIHHLCLALKRKVIQVVA